jgi:hypothetical protein
VSYYDVGYEDDLDMEAGWLEIAGDDDVEDLLAVSGADALIGARGRKKLPRSALTALARNKALLQTRGPTKARYYPLGIPATVINAGAAATITVRPQVPFRAQRFVVPSDIAGSFTIGDIRVGKNSQFVTADAVPARTFQEDAASGIEMGFDTAQVSQDISVVANNISLAAQTFRAVFWGAAVE